MLSAQCILTLAAYLPLFLFQRMLGNNFRYSLTLFECFYFVAQDYELDRDRIHLENILGEGQFGDVHAGQYTDKVQQSHM